MAEAAEWVTRLRAGLIPFCPRNSDVVMRRGRLETRPSRVMKYEAEFMAAHWEQLKEIARLPRPELQPVYREEAPKPASRPAKRKDRPATSPARVSSLPQRKPEPASPKKATVSAPQTPVVPKEPEPECYVGRYRVTEHDVKAMLSWFGDEELAAYESGRISKAAAYAQTADALRRSVRMGTHQIFVGDDGTVHMWPKRHLLSEHVEFLQRLGRGGRGSYRSRR